MDRHPVDHETIDQAPLPDSDWSGAILRWLKEQRERLERELGRHTRGGSVDRTPKGSPP